jgi:hypothetical protein
MIHGCFVGLAAARRDFGQDSTDSMSAAGAKPS